MSSTALRIASTGALLITLVVNALANILPINGLNTGEVSALYPSLFTPAGITFSIWTVIYILLIGFVVFSWLNRSDARIDRLQSWFIVTCVLNASWILVWHFLLPALSVVVMLMLLGALLTIFRIIQSSQFLSTKEIICVSLPFTFYLAWICVATIANVSALLVSAEWQGGFLSPEIWTVLMMVVAAILGFVVTRQFGTPAFIFVVMWALLGIYIRWQDSEYKLIVTSAILLEVVLAGFLIYYFKSRKVSH
ncbi:TspO/MBR family protein [Pseudochryseolinea flava]|uniref:Tryptophan-rich sensory protein n=1 Tax=Pseudochryseolinea flava TaxID=2059302 RepID=A0A364YB39_9BACT|nr:TspO/MBR family protein [Pseudochryseolinea flava]RAW03332.1 tryptophan-rich sensory protein [Pseudochryseolinea flava]